MYQHSYVFICFPGPSKTQGAVKIFSGNGTILMARSIFADLHIQLISRRAHHIVLELLHTQENTGWIRFSRGVSHSILDGRCEY
jgi:hypothetical protein